jgi:uroporphyrinogen decarboxylase
VPTIHHVARSGQILGEIGRAGGTVVGIDSRQEIGSARRRLGTERPVQGNLDPARVLAGSAHACRAAGEVLAAAGRRGHIFNLGEAAPRDADPGVLRDVAEFVHASFQAGGVSPGAARRSSPVAADA